MRLSDKAQSKFMGEHASVRGQIAPPNINVRRRDRLHVKNPYTGGYSSLYSSSSGNGRGEVLYPRVIKNKRGKWFVGSEKQAFNYQRKTGQHLGIYSSIKAADRAGTQFHNQGAALWKKRSQRPNKRYSGGRAG